MELLCSRTPWLDLPRALLAITDLPIDSRQVSLLSASVSPSVRCEEYRGSHWKTLCKAKHSETSRQLAIHCLSLALLLKTPHRSVQGLSASWCTCSSVMLSAGGAHFVKQSSFLHSMKWSCCWLVIRAASPLLAVEYHKAPVVGGEKCWVRTCREHVGCFGVFLQ